MKALGKILAWKMSNERLDTHVAMLACILGGLGIMAIGFRKLATLPVSDTEAFFGVLLVLTVSLQLICLGLLLPRQLSKDDRQQHAPASMFPPS